MNKKFFAFALIALLLPMTAGAQALKGSYFMDNSLSRHRLNPAFAPNTGYFELPAIGGLSFGLLSNLDLQTFLYPMNGQLNTFLHKDVSIRQFDKSLARKPHLDFGLDLNLLSFGWKRGDGFWTVDMGLRTHADMDISRDMFMFMKKGTGLSGTYNLGPMNLNIGASLQAAVGYSRDLSDFVPGLRVGAKIRGILPAAYAGVDFKTMVLETTQEKWTVRTDAQMYTSVSGLDLMDADGNFAPSFDISKLGLAGFGMSFDVGAEYRMEFDGFINSVNFSAAFTDIGFINYKAEATQKFSSSGSMDWTGIEDMNTDDAFSKLGDEFKKLLNIQKADKKTSLTRSSLPSFYAGVEMPFLNNMMSVGALYSARASYHYLRNELTLSYNLNPVKWFSLGLNYSFLNVAKSLGCVIELTPRIGPCLYLGCDYIPMEWTIGPDAVSNMLIPTSARVNLQFGIAFAIGGKR